jgi:hypothetical protein
MFAWESKTSEEEKNISEASPLSIIYTKSIQIFSLVFETFYFSKKRTISDEVANLVNAIKNWHLIALLVRRISQGPALVHSEFLF